MATYQAEIHVMLKPLVNDPQGLVVRDGLRGLGFDAVERVRVGKRIDVTLAAEDRAAAERAVEEMCRRLLANPVIEQFDFDVREAEAAEATS